MNHPPAEDFGNLPNPSEPFGNVPQHSESFGNVPNDADAFRTVRNLSERTENHTMTVREVARVFEQSGVPRTERSIVNWCRLNRQGIARLDAFFDENEGRYYITPQSVNRAIEEERAKLPANTQSGASSSTQTTETVPPHSENTERIDPGNSSRLKELERQNRDLEIATRAKDFYIERLEREQDRYVDQLVRTSRYVGELETKVLQLGGMTRPDHGLPQGAEEFSIDTEANEPMLRSGFPPDRVAP